MGTGEKHELRICFSGGVTSNQVDVYSSCKLTCCVSSGLSPSLSFAFLASSRTQSPPTASHSGSQLLISQSDQLFAHSQYGILCYPSTWLDHLNSPLSPPDLIPRLAQLWDPVYLSEIFSTVHLNNSVLCPLDSNKGTAATRGRTDPCFPLGCPDLLWLTVADAYPQQTGPLGKFVGKIKVIFIKRATCLFIHLFHEDKNNMSLT